MPFKHACFVSYRHHEQSELAERFISDLCSALRNELAVLLEEDLYVDRERLRGGTLFNPSLAGALCRSVCMIAVYTPTYFSRAYPYCAREYLAMERLEQIRLARLTSRYGPDAGFIIPVILRGENSLPPSIRGRRQYYTFERFSLTSRVLARNRQFETSVRQIASVIHERKEALTTLADELTCDCHKFALPTDEDVGQWLETMIPPAVPFPLR
jgi:TIR domain